MNDAATTTSPAAQERGWGYQIAFLGTFVCCATLLLYAVPLARPVLVVDDFQIVAASWTWDATIRNLWVPNNEHAMPLGRLTTWLLVALSGNMTNLPFAAVLQGILALLIAMWLTFLFVKREWGHPFFGLLAMALFGVTTIYQQAVYWFAASFSLLALDTMLLALLAAQRWRQAGRRHFLLLATLFTALAPLWFASGVLAGPLTCLYLLGTPPGQTEGTASKRSHLQWLFYHLRRRWWAMIPLLGTAGFLAVSVPLTAQRIMHLEHYQGETALEAFRPLTGLVYTGRSIVENLALGTLGISGVSLPPIADFALLGILAFGVYWRWKWTARRDLIVLGIALVVLSYLLTYSARGAWDWDENGFTQPQWSRYHLLPQFGLTLISVAALPSFMRWLDDLNPDGSLSSRQRRRILILTLLLFLIHLPRSMVTHWYNPRDWAEQQAGLRRIVEMDALCRRHRIDAAQARAVLPPLAIRLGPPHENGWQFLRGSDLPLAASEEEVRRILLPNSE